MERISLSRGDLLPGEAEGRRKSNKAAGASGFLNGKLLSATSPYPSSSLEPSDYDHPSSRPRLLPSAMKGKGSSGPV